MILRRPYTDADDCGPETRKIFSDEAGLGRPTFKANRLTMLSTKFNGLADS